MALRQEGLRPLNKLHLIVGISRDHVDELIHFTHEDPHFQTHTSDLHKPNGDPGRFSSREAFYKWVEKGGGRQIYTLATDENNHLAGIIWFGRSQLSVGDYDWVATGFKPDSCGITYAIRLYGPARGKHLAAPFTRRTLDHFKTTDFFRKTPNKRVWLETDADNEPAIKAYKSLGCITVATGHPKGRILMVFP